MAISWFMCLLTIILLNTVSSQPLLEVFRDDFDSNVLNLTKWNAVDEPRYSINSYLTPRAVKVEGGYLKIRSDRQPLHGRNFSSGSVESNNYHFQYGEIEWRARPSKRGTGFSAYLWLLDSTCAVSSDVCGTKITKYPAEADIIFPPGSPNDIITKLAPGKDDDSYTVVDKSEMPFDLTMSNQTYRIIWSKDLLAFYVDSLEVIRVEDSNKIPQTPMRIVMSQEIDDSCFCVNYAVTGLPVDFLIDYVVVRQNATASDTKRYSVGSPAFVGALVGGLIGLVMLLSIGVLLFVWIKKRNLEGRTEFTHLSGSTSPSQSMSYMKTGNVPLDILLQQYIDLMKIPAENLEVGDLLGKGQFGIVYKGVAKGLRGQSKAITVAVKIPTDLDGQEQLNEEIRIMTKLGRHLNVVNLLGVIVKSQSMMANPSYLRDSKEPDLMLLLEYCPHGCLLTYLETHRDVYFYNHVDRDGKLLPYDKNEETRVADDARQLPGRQIHSPEGAFDDQVMSTRDLISFAYQISRGMEYLASRSIIHRDLAARNVLVSDRKIIKISDFGMARQRQTVYVLENSQVPLPVKWMSPEAIINKTFSQKSDIWSYGILLWEMFTLGEMPYDNFNIGSSLWEFVAWLTAGNQMDRPICAPLEICDIQKRCWLLKMDDRPTFSELSGELEKMVCHDLRDSYLALNEPYHQFNKCNEDLLNRLASAEQQCSLAERKEDESADLKCPDEWPYVTMCPVVVPSLP